MEQMISIFLAVLSFEEKKTCCENIDKFNRNVRIPGKMRHFLQANFSQVILYAV